MVLNEDGFDAMDDWFYWFADAVVVIPLILICIYIQYYSHVGERFGRNLSTLNVIATLTCVLLRFATFFYRDLCAFFLIETTYFVCEFNLFHFRTALFYQTDKKFYNRLYHVLLIGNYINLYHNFSYFIQQYRIYPLIYGCRNLPGIPTYSVALPSMAVQLYMLGLGFYTVGKFWRESGSDARRRMRILWLVLFTFTWDFISALFLLMFSGTSAEILLFREAFQFFNKSLSLFLALMVYLKVRERSGKSGTASNNQTSKTKSGTIKNDTRQTPGKVKLEMKTANAATTASISSSTVNSATERYKPVAGAGSTDIIPGPSAFKTLPQ